MALLDSLRAGLAARRGIRAFREQPVAFRELVFFSEGPEYWDYFAPLIRRLLEGGGTAVSFLSSRRDDPALSLVHERYRAFFIGDGLQRTALFRTLEAKVVVLTMPDLESLYLKRSLHPVRYLYLFHSMVSSHMIYRKGAFDHYDAICCVGPHHVEEIRATESLYGLPPKELAAVGYPRLDRQLEDARRGGGGEDAGERRVLVAPSWGEQGIFESCGEALVERLLACGYRVVLRPHPQTARLRPDVIERLRRRVAADERLTFDGDVGSYEQLRRADLMISDWSGAALEFAFAYEKPVLFIDVPRKVRNPDYLRIPNVPLEVAIRERIGALLRPDELDRIGETVERLCADREGMRKAIAQARAEYVFNPGASVTAAVALLSRMLGRGL